MHTKTNERGLTMLYSLWLVAFILCVWWRWEIVAWLVVFPAWFLALHALGKFSGKRPE